MSLKRPHWLPRPDGSRDLATDDPTNVWFVHPLGRLLLPLALRLRIPANAVSVAGFLLGAAGAAALLDWRERATLAFLLCVAWLVADGLDGMIARATGSASALGRFLDGVCDHAVFVLVYLALAWALNSPGAWALGLAAGAAHAVQSTLFEGERIRFHRRLRGEPLLAAAPSANLLVRLYDSVAGSLDRLAAPFDAALAASADPAALIARYRARAAPAMRLLALLSNNMRVILIWLACLAGDPRLFWWVEIGPLTLLAAAGIAWHRRVERSLA
ncbi:MAG: CDP-alcohol phosphatidyltransferase family protein [Alphaproteobacteria bacterium]|nr:CDP-alcohol phosphatidyltransferase family protein [Alphaproteobacteria bacterium]MBV9370958.1 CDP-alcohol phosphatidyltransferase family protein [Alphaproteobacteria bacterium]MBV9899501.1 CDP-alcohol phosphatidyltransferase family protein [Alphaproteobacteria bacterium]